DVYKRQAALNLLSIARHSLGKTLPSAASDLGVAVWTAHACLQGALLNVAANLSEINDGQFSVQVAKEVDHIKKMAAYYKGEFDNVFYGQEMFLMLD
ncbi:MAG: cyclodeaminase/cyclohydrolase family protein, partial [Negativicutes bacterium]|nr:cyclodeaminase/cyclohydrolase family protein [Negativicutes bacterium]